MKTKALLAAMIFCFVAVPALAAPTIESAEDQSFYENDKNDQARDITIVDDSLSPMITASGDIRIKIPEEFPIVWDDRVSSVNLSGSAVTAGRFLANGTAAVTYENHDKVAVVDVSVDFAAGEDVLVAGLTFEGFYWAGANARLELVLQSGGEKVATDAKSLQVWTSTYSDGDQPEAPSNVQIWQTADDEVKIIWSDPSDMDAKQIQILRGVAPMPVSGSAYSVVARGDEEFIDMEVELGQTISYIIRGNDGLNLGDNSEEVSITLVENLEPAPVVCTLDYTPVCGSDGETYPNACNAEASGVFEYTSGECVVEKETEITEEEAAKNAKAVAAGISVEQLDDAVAKYSDLDLDHWSAGFLAQLNSDKIIDGYSNGTIQPDTTINRAELAKIAVNSFALETTTQSFSDIGEDDWFAPFVGALEVAGASWTSSDEFFPATGVSRGEAVWTLLTAAGIEIPAASEKPFPDVSISHPYAAAIAWAKDNEIISGYENGNFGTNDTLTRAQVAKVVVLLKAKLAE